MRAYIEIVIAVGPVHRDRVFVYEVASEDETWDAVIVASDQEIWTVEKAILYGRHLGRWSTRTAALLGALTADGVEVIR